MRAIFAAWDGSRTTATDTALLITSESLVTLLLAVLVLGERLRRRTALAVGIGAAGVYVIVEHGLTAPHLPTGGEALGDALVVASLVLESCATIAGASLMARSRAPITLTAAAIVVSLAVWVPAGAGVAIHSGPPRLDAAGWAGVLYLAVVTTVIAYGGWYWGLQRLSAQDVTPILLVQPLAGTAIAAIVRGERPGSSTIVGGILVLAGVALVALRRQAPGVEAAAVASLAPEAP